MSLQSWIIERMLRLPPALTRNVTVTKDLRIPAYDGVELLADLYAPHTIPNAPTLLIRTPYGRRGLLSRVLCRPFAERGYNVLVATVRGTDRAGGTFDPLAGDDADGLATLDWIEKQPWHQGKVVTFGPSYLGYVQLAMAPEAGDRISAMVPMITTSKFRDIWYSGDSFQLNAILAWTARIVTGERGALRADVGEIKGDKRARKAMDHLPLSEADTLGTGRRVRFFQDWLANTAPDSPYWDEREHRNRIGEITAPTLLFGGWQDIVLPGMLDDYVTMRAAGRDPYLTIGPWLHTDFTQAGPAITEALDWFRAHLNGDSSGLRELPVRLYIQGADEWREYSQWPPAGAVEQNWHLQPAATLGRDHGTGGTADRFRYDPADPTPTVGGPLLDQRTGGRKDNTELESRPDVLVYTSEPLGDPVEVIGPISARIDLRTSTENADVFVRICDVDPKGRSTNVCDGLQRITVNDHPTDDTGIRSVPVRMWPTAYRFERGHRLRVQVSGGSFPRFARNTGTGEALGSATDLAPVDYEILHSSTVTLSSTPLETDRPSRHTTN